MDTKSAEEIDQIDHQEPLPMELRLFSHDKFEADEYVQGVCRDVGTGAQMRRQLEKLRDLRSMAHELLKQDAREQAESYVAATARIRDTGRALAELGNQALILETGLERLDQALTNINDFTGNSNRTSERIETRLNKIVQEDKSTRHRPHGLEAIIPTCENTNNYQSPRNGDDESDCSSLSENVIHEKNRTSFVQQNKRYEKDAIETKVNAVDSLVRSGQTARAVATWLDAKREMRRLRRRLERHGDALTEEIEALGSRLEARKKPLASLAEAAAFDKDPDSQYAQICFGFGTSLKDAAANVSTLNQSSLSKEHNTIQPPHRLFEKPQIERIERARSALLHALGFTDRARDSRFLSYTNAMRRNLIPKHFWTGLAFVLADLWILFGEQKDTTKPPTSTKHNTNSSKKKKQSEYSKESFEYYLIQFASNCVNELVNELALTHLSETSVASNAQVFVDYAKHFVQELSSGTETYDRLGLVNDFPQLTANSLLVNSLTPLISKALNPFRLPPEEFRLVLHSIWPPLKSRIEQLDDQL